MGLSHSRLSSTGVTRDGFDLVLGANRNLRGDMHQVAGCPASVALSLLPGAPTFDNLAWRIKSISTISVPGRAVDSWGNGLGGGFSRVKCQVMAWFPGWAGATHLCLP